MEPVDLGGGFAYSFFCWDPDRGLNPQYAEIPSVDKAGIILYKDGETIGSCWFDTPEVRRIPGAKKVWQLVSLDPLHLEPSIQTYTKTAPPQPQHHGHIRRGRWEKV